MQYIRLVEEEETGGGPSGPTTAAETGDADGEVDQTNSGEQEGELAPQEYDVTDSTPVLIYGIVADCLIIIPLILYLAAGGSGRHHLWITTTYMTWFPFAALWIISQIYDNEMVRIAMRGALNMAGIGPWAAQWGGWIGFMMGSTGMLSDTYTILWSILYACINIGLMAMEWHIGPGVAKWIDNAPFAEESILEEELEEGAEEIEEETEL